MERHYLRFLHRLERLVPSVDGEGWRQEIAADPSRFPDCGAEIWAEVAEKPNERVEFDCKKLHYKDWTASESRSPPRTTIEFRELTCDPWQVWHTLRIDIPEYGVPDYIESILVVHDLQIPLLDLFRPPETYAQ